MAKETNPKNAALESDVLKAAGNAAPPVNQQGIKDQAQAIGDQANQAGAQTIPGITETMAGEPAPGIQLPGSNLPPVTNAAMEGAVPLTFGNPAPGNQPDPEYVEFLEWKKKKADADQAAANQANKTTPFENPDREIKRLNTEKLHEERVKMYGDGYVVARRLNVEQVFTRTAWNLLGGRNNQEGYREVVAAPPEVAHLNKAQ
jgi:hypothetical protein